MQLPEGQLSWEAIVLGAICPGIHLPRGQVSGAAIMRGTIVLEQLPYRL